MCGIVLMVTKEVLILLLVLRCDDNEIILKKHLSMCYVCVCYLFHVVVIVSVNYLC